jgi:H+/Cl- antiporter ClcA
LEKQKNFLFKKISGIIPCIFFGALCGAVSGALIFLFKLLYSYLADLSVFLYSEAKSSLIYIVILFSALVVLAAFMIFIHIALPEVKGGGIPRSEGILRGTLSFRPLKTLIGAFAGSMISFFGGLPLGSEGPAVLIGTSVGNLCMGSSGKKNAWSRYVMTGGASAGFAVATGAPLSGLLFSLEEIHKRFTPILVLTVSVSVISATFVNEILSDMFGISTYLFHIDALPNIELSHVGYLLLLGISVSVGVAIFDASISIFHKFMSTPKKSVRPWMEIVLVFIFSGIIGLTLTDGVFSGHDTVHTAIDITVPILYLLIIFIIRLLKTLVKSDE